MSLTFTRWSFMIGCVGLLACDDGGERPELDATVIDASVSDASVSDAGSVDTPVDSGPVPDAGLAADAALPASGTCAVIGSSRIAVPSDFDGFAGFQRVLGGFAMSWTSLGSGGINWLFSLPEAVSQLRVPAAPGSQQFCLVPVADDGTRPAVILTSFVEGPPGTQSALTATAWRGTPAAFGPIQTIGEAFYRGTTRAGCAPSFDGKRAVVTSGHVNVDPPEAIMVGLDGARVGQAAPLGFTSDQPLFDCLTVTPTEHGAAVSALDTEGSNKVFRLVELGSDGAVLQTIAHPVDAPNLKCSVVVASPTGIVAALPRADTSFQVVELSASQVRELPAPPPPTGLPRWIGKAADGGTLWLESTEARSLRMLHVSIAGTARVLAEDLGSADVLRGESGRLFLTRARSPNELPIDEVVCAP